MNAPDLVGAVWRKSTRSAGNGGQCVEVAFVADAVAVRDSKDKAGPALLFTAAQWDAFLTGVKSGKFEAH